MSSEQPPLDTSLSTNADISLPDADDAEESSGGESSFSTPSGSDNSDVIVPSRTFTPSERIQQLNLIDKDIASLLSTAAHALQSANNREEFTAHTQRYHALVNSITVGIRRQMLALEQADVMMGGAGSDGVGRAKEAELWRRARSMIEQKTTVEGKAEEMSQAMDVDNGQ